IIKHLNRHGVPSFSAPESCASALAALLSASKRPAMGSLATMRDAGVEPAASALIPSPSGMLDEAESKRLFQQFGIRSVKEVVVATPETAEAAARGFGVPVVVKILSRAVAHKSEIGGVAVGVRAEDVAVRCRAMRAAAEKAGTPIDGFLVQE